MRKLIMAVAVVGLVAFHAGEAQAQVSFGVQASYGDEADLGLGARLYAGLPFTNVRFVGSFDYFFPDIDAVDYFEINANAIYTFELPETPAFSPYAGAGLNIARGSVESAGIKESDTEMGLNLIGGAEFGLGPIRPFAELRIELSGGEQTVLSGGIRF